MANGPHPISMLPDSAKLMHVTTNIVATDSKNPWFQLGLKIDLYKSDSPLPGLDVRILRIGTAGTIINTLAYRGKDKTAHPFSQNMEFMFDKTKIDIWEDEKRIFDKFIFKIENYHPDHSSERTHIVNPIDWILADFSPKTKNKESMLSTSTSIGFDVGSFGSTATAGVNYSQSQSREWSIEDYELFGSASVDMSHPSSVTWNVHRSSQDSDPDIAKSTFSPDFESVFRSSQSSERRRYSIISAIAIPVFLDQKSEKVEVKSSSFLTKAIFALHNIFSGKKIQNNTIETKINKYYGHVFSVTLLVDWVTGRVETVLPPDSSGRVRLSSASWSDGKEVNNEGVKDLMEGLMPAIASGVEEPELVYPRYEGDDPVGKVTPGKGVTSIEVVIPPDLLFYYYGGVSVSQGLSFKDSSLQALWGPFSNTLLIRGIESTDPILISPKGYFKGDDDRPSVAKEPEKPGESLEHTPEQPKEDHDAPAAAQGGLCVSTHGTEVVVAKSEEVLGVGIMPSGTGFEFSEGTGFQTVFCVEDFKYTRGLDLEKGLTSSLKQVRASRFAWIGLDQEGVGLGLYGDSLSLSGDCFASERKTVVLPDDQRCLLNGKQINASEMLKDIGASKYFGSVIISYPMEKGILNYSNMNNVMETIHQDIYFSIIGKNGIAFVNAGSLLSGISFEPDLMAQANFLKVKFDEDDASNDLPNSIKYTLEAYINLKSKKASNIYGSCISRNKSDPESMFIHHFGI